MRDKQMSSISFYLPLSSSIFSVPSPKGEARRGLQFPSLREGLGVGSSPPSSAMHLPIYIVTAAVAFLQVLIHCFAPCLGILVFFVFHVLKAYAATMIIVLVTLVLHYHARVISCSLAPCIWTILS